mgnify:CR=1 FL=1
MEYVTHCKGCVMASTMAQKFSRGVSSWTWWVGPRMSPPPAPMVTTGAAPEVDSAVLVGVTRERRLAERDEDELWRLVQAGFRERRKMIHNVLARQLPGLDRERVGAGLAACGIAPKALISG